MRLGTLSSQRLERGVEDVLFDARRSREYPKEARLKQGLVPRAGHSGFSSKHARMLTCQRVSCQVTDSRVTHAHKSGARGPTCTVGRQHRNEPAGAPRFRHIRLSCPSFITPKRREESERSLCGFCLSTDGHRWTAGLRFGGPLLGRRQLCRHGAVRRGSCVGCAGMAAYMATKMSTYAIRKK
jgi:hypothetical protein